MMINKCEKCNIHSLDTLTDGTKEHYCSPPIYIPYYSIPCKNREHKDCIKLRKMVKKMKHIENSDISELLAHIGKNQ